MVNQTAVEDFIAAIRQEQAGKTTTHSATISRVDEEGTVWVYIAGSDIETPTASSSVEAKPGDAVIVEWRNDKLYIAGNYSDPAASSVRVNAVQDTAFQAAQAANSAQLSADIAKESAETASTAAAQAVADAATASSAAAAASSEAAAASTAAASAQASADAANDNLKSVVQGATTVERAVSVMQTALEAVVDYDPENDTTQEYFWHDVNGAHVLGATSGYRSDITSTGMDIIDVSTENSVAQFGVDGIRVGISDGSNFAIGTDELFARNSDQVPFFSVDYDGGQTVGTARADLPVINRLSVSESSYSKIDKATFADANNQIVISENRMLGATISLDFLFDTSVTPQLSGLTLVQYRDDAAFLWLSNGTTTFTVGTAGSASRTAVFTLLDGGTLTFTETLSYTVENQEHVVSRTVTIEVSGSTLFRRAFLSLTSAKVETTVITKAPSFTFGTNGSDTNGSWSSRLGQALTAEGDHQTAIGKYNDNQSDTVFEIGNGTSSTASNALTVDWTGNIELALDTSRTATASVDYALYEAILALGWENDVID